MLVQFPNLYPFSSIWRWQRLEWLSKRPCVWPRSSVEYPNLLSRTWDMNKLKSTKYFVHDRPLHFQKRVTRPRKETLNCWQLVKPFEIIVSGDSYKFMQTLSDFKPSLGHVFERYDGIDRRLVTSKVRLDTRRVTSREISVLIRKLNSTHKELTVRK